MLRSTQPGPQERGNFTGGPGDDLVICAVERKVITVGSGRVLDDGKKVPFDTTYRTLGY